MIEDIIFLIILPVLFLGITALNFNIRKNNRYDILFGINWDSIRTNNRKKLLNWITCIGIIFGIISTFYFPIIQCTSFNDLYALLMYFGITIIMVFIVFSAIIIYSKGYR